MRTSRSIGLSADTEMSRHCASSRKLRPQGSRRHENGGVNEYRLEDCARPAGISAIRAGAGGTILRVVAADGCGGEISRTESDTKFSGSAGTDRRNRESNFG